MILKLGLRGGVVPTLNVFDNNSETRATVVIVMREREGKAGGGKGALLANDLSFTLSTSNFQTLFIFEATRVDDCRFYENYCPTVATYWGTGGARVRYVYAIQSTVIGRKDENGPQGKGYREDGEPMFTLDGAGSHAVAFQLSGDRDNASVSISDVAYCLPSNPMSDRNQSISYQTKVRRLTPRECERLQGFPDDWTADQADSNRYKQMGNAVAVPVVSWIIQRLVNE